MNSRRLYLSLFIALLLMPAVAAAQLQDICTPIRYLESGDRVERDIDDINYIWAFCFDAEAGDTVSVDIEVVSGDLVAFTSILEQSTEQVVAAEEDLSSKTTPATLTYTVQNPGTYIIAVGRSGGETGPSTGTYAVTFNMEPSGDMGMVASGECPSEALAIEPNTDVKGSIDDETYFVAYCFSAEAGDTVTFETTTSGGDLDTVLMLSDADLTASYIENDDVESGNTNSALSYEIQDAGNYVIAVGRYGAESGVTAGSFVLSFELEAGAGDPGGLVKEPAPGDGSGELACDEDPLNVMIAGLWQITSDELVMTFDFECDGNMSIQLNKEPPFSAAYTLEPDDSEVTYTLTISLSATDELVLSSAVIAESGILALLQGDTPDDETLIFMENTLYEEE